MSGKKTMVVRPKKPGLYHSRMTQKLRMYTITIDPKVFNMTNPGMDFLLVSPPKAW